MVDPFSGTTLDVFPLGSPLQAAFLHSGTGRRQTREHLRKEPLLWVVLRHLKKDPAHADLHQRPDLQELRAQPSDLSFGPLGSLKAPLPRPRDQDAGEAQEPKAHLIDPHLVSRGPVGK